LQIDGGCELTQVTFARNRFYKITDGFFFKKPQRKPYPSLGMTLDSNTLCEMERGVLFETAPVERFPVTARNNLFVQVKTIVQVNELPAGAGEKLFPPEGVNVRDDKSKEGNVNLKCVQADCSSVSRDLGNDRQN